MPELLEEFYSLVPGAGLADFTALLGAVYTVHILLYFGLGGLIHVVNLRNQNRRIQANRRGEKRWRVEVKQSLISILVTSFSLSFGLFAQSAGWTIAPAEFSWITAAFWLLACMVLFDAWFYFGHRLMHTKAFYKFHALHHRSVAPTVWSTFSDDPFDTLVMQGYYMAIVFIVPFPPAILIAHRLIDHFNGTFGHCGFEYFASKMSRWPSLMLCVAFHDQHHSGFKYNYANYFSFWDRVLHTLHPDYDGAVTRMEQMPPIRLTRVTSNADIKQDRPHV